MLDDYTDAAQAVAHKAARRNRRLDQAGRQAAIEQHYAGLVAARTGQVPLPPPLAPPPLSLAEHFERWIELEGRKVSVRTGRPLSADTLWTHGAVLRELQAFATHRRQALTFEGLNQDFYEDLRNYMLRVAGRSPRTFNTYVKRLRSFLFWAEGQLLPVLPLFRRTLRLAPSYVGKEALTQDELLRVAALNFQATAVLSYLEAAFPEPPPKPTEGRGGRNALTSAEHLQRAEWTRDLFLLCAYTSLRHGDAQELGWQHVFPE